MAMQKRATKTAAYRQIGEDIQNSNIKNVVLLYGKERYLVDWAVNELINAYINPATKELDFIKIDAADMTLGQIISSCETMPMFSEKKVIFIDQFTLLEPEGKLKNFTESDEKELAAYLPTVSDQTLLIMNCGEKINNKKKLCKTIIEEGSIYDFSSLDKDYLRKFIIKKMKAAKKISTNGVIDKIIDESGYYDKETEYTLYNLNNDIEKLIEHSEGDEITKDDVNETLSGNIEKDVFKFIDALSKGKKGEALNMLNTLLSFGENEYKILALIFSQFETILCVKEMKELGISNIEMNKILKIHEYRIKIALGLSKRFSIERLKQIIQKAYEIDRNIKTGTLEKNLAFELFVSQV